MRKQIAKRYVWPKMGQQIKEYVKTCWKCQRRGGPRENNVKITIPPGDIFQRWGIDIVGPLPQTEEGYRYIVVAMDYFTRWPEAKPLRYANAKEVATFIYEEIICRYGCPAIIQSDNGLEFVNEIIKQLMEKFQIWHQRVSPYYP